MNSRWILAIVIGSAATALAQPPGPEEFADYFFDRAHERRVVLEWEILVHDPGDPVGTYQPLAGGALSERSESDQTTASSVRWEEGGKVESGHTIEVRSEEHDSGSRIFVDLEPTGASRFPTVHESYDLPVLAAGTFELGRTSDGRLLRLNVKPAVRREAEEARPLSAKEIDLFRWNFGGAVLHNHEYRGQLGDSGGPILHVSFPDLGAVEFSLQPFDGGTPLGEFYPEVRSLVVRSPSGGALSFQGVTVGNPPLDLRGGPYTVWAQWGPPLRTAEEARRLLEKALQKPGNEITPELRQQLFDRIERGMIQSHGSGRIETVRRHLQDE